MTMEGDKQNAAFSFQYLDGKKFLSIDGKETSDNFMKWGMRGRIKAQSFSFDQQFQGYQKDEFVLAFFQDPYVTTNLQILSSNDKWCPVGVKATSVNVEAVPCTLTSMGFFDRLTDDIVRGEEKYIKKCFDEFYEDFQVSDELRKMLLIEDSDFYDLYSDSERSEFLFLLFKHLCLGGQVCQYEDVLGPYLQTTQLMYKDLVSVQKDPETKEIRVSSLVFKVMAVDDSGPYFPSDKEHEQSFAYLIVDPIKRHVTCFSHKFSGGIMFG